jgi:hypothetical protein
LLLLLLLLLLGMHGLLLLLCVVGTVEHIRVSIDSMPGNGGEAVCTTTAVQLRSCFVTVTPTQADLAAGTPVSLQATASAAGLPAVQSAVVSVPAAQNYTAVVALTAAPTYVVGEQCC